MAVRGYGKMTRRAIFIGLYLVFTASLVIGLLAIPYAANAQEEGLILYFSFEDEGDTAIDDSGNGNDGNIVGGVEWVESLEKFGKALQFNGSNTAVRAPYIPLDERSFTVMMWVNPVLFTGEQVVFSQNQSGAGNLSLHFRLGGPASPNVPTGGIRMGFYSNDLDTAGGLIEDNTWYHMTFWYDFDTKTRRIYLDGEMQAEDAGVSPYLGTSGDTVVGTWDINNQWFQGIIDEVRVYDYPVDEQKIQNAIKGSMAVHTEGKLTTTWGRIRDYK
jgi:hypothetical protein